MKTNKIESFLKLKREFIKKEPQLSKIMLACNIKQTKQVPTMGVSITKKPNLYYNPEFLKVLTLKQGVAILTHEMYHLLNLHPARGKDKHPRVFNYATDISINQFIKGLPKDCLKPSLFRLKKKKHSEYYYNKLLKNAKEIEGGMKEGKKGEDGDKRGDHSKWGESISEKEAEQVMQKVVDDYGVNTNELNDLDSDVRSRQYALDQAKDQDKEMDVTNVKTIDWDDIMKKLRDIKYQRIKKRTIYRTNKRYKHLPGKARTKLRQVIGKNQVKKLIIAIDVSYSIDDHTCAMFLKNIAPLEKWVDDLIVIQCSDNIHDVRVIKKQGKRINPISFTRKGTGGTSFIPVFDYIQKHNNPKKNKTCLLYLTDLEGDFPDDDRNIQTVWVTPRKDDVYDVPFGEVFSFE